MPKKSTQPAAPAIAPGLNDLKALIDDKRAAADSESLLHEILEAWGGPKKLARDLYGEFQEAAPGGVTRQRILDMIQRLIVTNTTHDIGRPINPGDQSDDELLATAARLLGKANAHAPRPAATPDAP